ncbi:MAG TPA: MFS transporter [Solirubrobacteraceae bacterium]|nr:MFS transporter [Solirubrobacteraceae bacterium]
MSAVPAAATVTAWSPLRHKMFRALYTAQFASNAGTFMQLVGAQWLMGDLGGSALEVSLIQAATSLPVFLLVLPGGALGDILDRRKLLLVAQGWMLIAAAALAVLTAADAMTPVLLLALTFAIGTGTALTIPSFQAVMPELVDRPEIRQAAALNGVNFNVARAVGPAIGGVVIAAAGPAWVFGANAISFLGTLAVIAAWRREQPPRSFGVEHMWGAIVAGGRFVRSAPAFRAVLLRAALFMPFAGALWALLPVLARDELGLGSSGYGVMLGAVGIGAFAGAFLLPRMRERLPLNALIGVCSLLYGGATLVTAVVHVEAVVVAALVLAGLGWIGVLSSLNGSAQTLLPDWARARGLAYYTLTFQGAQTVGAIVWGSVAGIWGVEWAMGASAIGVGIGVAFGRRRPLVALDIDLRPAGQWSEPHLVIEPNAQDGPVLVTVEWCVDETNADAFREAMRAVERARRRSGARRWGLYRDGAKPDRFIEAYTVATWEEHVRQQQRVTVRDREIEDRARALARNGSEPEVRRYFGAFAEAGV